MYAMQIQTGELRETDLPNGYGEWSDYAKFAVTFAPRDRDLCSEAASDAFARWRRTGDVPRTLEELRAYRIVDGMQSESPRVARFRRR